MILTKTQLKRAILKLINLFINPFGVKIVNNSHDQFTMSSGLKIIVDHGITVNSILDIGASDGKWSAIAIDYFSNAQVCAIEPLKERQRALEYLQKKHRLFVYEQCVAGSVDDVQVLLNVDEDLDGSAIGGRGGTKRYVKQKTIDSIVEDKKLPSPFLMKFDTHGYELPIIEGATKTLQYTNVIIMEVYNFNITHSSLRFYEMCSHMSKLGFECSGIVDPMLRIYDKAFWQMDIIFYRKENEIFTYNEYR